MGRATGIRRIFTVAIATLLAVFGISGTTSAQTITNTGPGSANRITSHATSDCARNIRNQITVNSSSRQTARSAAGDSSDSTSQPAWTGWDTLNPGRAQLAGISYGSWQNAVTDWMTNHAAGTGWIAADVSAGTPSGTSWMDYDPLVWQAGGQSFADWYGAAAAYLDVNSASRLLTWPTDATGSMPITSGTTTGSAINTNNAGFSIILNNARTDSAALVCAVVANVPADGGGMGGGPQASGGQDTAGRGDIPDSPDNRPDTDRQGRASSGPGAAFGSPGGVSSSVDNGPSSPIPHSSGGAANTGPGNNNPAPAPDSAITNTGPGSNNTISGTAVNNGSASTIHTIIVSNSSIQAATSGDTGSGSGTGNNRGESGGTANANATGAIISAS